MKKMLILILMLLLITPQNKIVFSAENAYMGNDESIKKIASFGIGDPYNESNNYEQNATRSDLAILVVKMLNMQVIQSESIFSDTPIDFMATSYINTIVNMGLMSGFSDKTFRPMEPLTIENIAKVMVSAAGYKVQAELKGGYPLGYMQIASDKGILKGVNQADPISKRVLAKMIDNTLFIPYLKQISIGENYTYQTNPKVTIAREYLNIYEDKGRTDAVGEKRFYGVPAVTNGKILINDNSFDCQIGDIKSYLGYNVQYYYRQTEEKKEVLFMKVQNQVGTKTIRGKYILNSTNTQLNYTDENDKEMKANLSNVCSMFVNGMGVAFDKEYYEQTQTISGNKMQDGAVELIDNDGDSVYDVVSVHSYHTYYIKSINEKDKKIAYRTSFIDGDNGIIDLIDNTEYDLFIDGERNDSIANIQINSIMKVEIDVFGNYNKIIVSTNSIEGVLQEKADKKTISVEDTSYKMSPSVSNSEFERLLVGRSYRFIVDMNNEIVSFVSTLEKSDRVGYLIALSKGLGLFNAVQIKVLDSDGKINYYTLADKMKFTVGSQKTESIQNIDLLDKKELYDANTVQQVLVYTINANDLVNSILISEPTGWPNANDSVFTTMKDSVKMTYRTPRFLNNSADYKNRQTPPVITHNGASVLFQVPAPNSVNANDDTKFKIGSLNTFTIDSEYTVKAFGNTRDQYAKAIVAYSDKSSSVTINDTAKLCVVEKISSIIDDNGDIATKLTGIMSGRSVSYIISKDHPIALKSGDIIRFAMDSENEIANCAVVFDVNNELLTNKVFPTTNIPVVMKGRAAEVDTLSKVMLLDTVCEDTTKVKIENSIPIDLSLMITSPMVVYKSSGKVGISTFPDIQPGDYVVAMTYYTNLVDLVIIKE